MANLGIRPKQFEIYNHLLLGCEIFPFPFIYNGMYLVAGAFLATSFALHWYFATGSLWKYLVASEPRLNWYFYLICPLAYAFAFVISIFYASSDLALLSMAGLLFGFTAPRVKWTRRILAKYIEDYLAATKQG
jgi:hypothetical protein